MSHDTVAIRIVPTREAVRYPRGYSAGIGGTIVKLIDIQEPKKVGGVSGQHAVDESRASFRTRSVTYWA